MFYWHNTPIWDKLQSLGFKEVRTTFQGIYIGKCICEAEINGVCIMLEMHENTAENRVSISANKNNEHIVSPCTGLVTTYKRWNKTAVRGAYANILQKVENLINS